MTANTSSLCLRYTGCLLGSALGDALGAPYEGGWAERGLWRLLGRTRNGLLRYTDDTQMSQDLARSLLACGRWQPADAAERFAHSYRWHRGYGPGAARVLRSIRAGQPWESARFAAYPQGSWGNGGAMRAHVAALWCFPGEASQTVALAREQAAVTHGHALAQDGAALVAAACLVNLRRRSGHAVHSADWLEQVVEMAGLHEPAAWQPRLAQAQQWLASASTPSAREVAAALGHGISALESCVSALYVAARFEADAFGQWLRFVQCLGGDVDTIAAMAGSIYGAARGLEALPCEALAQLEDLQALQTLAWQLAQRACRS